ncbi:unnamed protein product [Paramecium pentaurelia]|uniref:Ubiquitin-like protease family profile domain-containing protein n=1 Tax=Paramecium pentaurelia TaxID=43138 RepID=A0A8S1S954_9CILI|nr:unnamed protein product [Paramecium pentaurelia]
MNQRRYKKKITSQQQQQETPLKLKLKEKFGQNIFYIQPNNYSIEMKQFNFRNPTYGVTVEYKFLAKIQECDYLESSQLQFFMNLFRKAYSKVKLAAATCYFFSDLVLTSQKPQQSQQQPQIIKIDWKRPNVEVKSQEQNKIEDPLNQIIQKEISSQQNNQQKSNQDSLETKNLSLNNNDKSQLTQLQKQEKEQEINNDKVEQQPPQSQIIPSNSINQLKQSLQEEQNQLDQNKKQDNNNIDIPKKNNLCSQKFQLTQQNQKNNQTKTDQFKKNSQQDSALQKQEINPTTNNIKQNEEKNQQQNVSLNQQKIDKALIYENKAQDKIVQKQIDPIVQEKQKVPFEQVPEKQKVPFEQVPVKQVQVETQIQQSQPEKKYHFQIINITQEVAPPQEIIQKSQLGQLMKQFAEINNLQVDQLKDQDYWFFPVNILQTHWISVVVQFNPKQIYYFDSYYEKIDPLIIKGIHSVLEHQNVDPQNFQIKPIYNQQTNNYDCGIFLLLSLLYTLKNQEYNYNQRLVDKFRRQLLYNLAVIGAQIDINKDSFEYLIALE